MTSFSNHLPGPISAPSSLGKSITPSSNSSVLVSTSYYTILAKYTFLELLLLSNYKTPKDTMESLCHVHSKLKKKSIKKNAFMEGNSWSRGCRQSAV